MSTPQPPPGPAASVPTYTSTIPRVPSLHHLWSILSYQRACVSNLFCPLPTALQSCHAKARGQSHALGLLLPGGKRPSPPLCPQGAAQPSLSPPNPHLLPFSQLLTLLQPHRPPYCSPNMQGMGLPSGLRMGCALCLEPPPPDTHLQTCSHLLLTHPGVRVGEWKWEKLAED